MANSPNILDTPLITAAQSAALAAAAPPLTSTNPPAVIASVPVNFVETAGAGIYSDPVSVPAGWMVDSFKISGLPWAAATALLRIGDVGSATRFVNDLTLASGDLDPGLVWH